MRDPSLPGQAAVFAALTAVAGAVAVHDEVPLDNQNKIKAAFPFFHIGEDQVVFEPSSCGELSSLYATVQVFSRGVGLVETKRLMALAVAGLDINLAIAGFACATRRVDDGPRYFREPDGQTKRGVVTFEYRLAPVP